MKKNIFVKSSILAFLFIVMIMAYPRVSLAVTCTSPGVPAGCTSPYADTNPAPNTTITPVAPVPTITSTPPSTATTPVVGQGYYPPANVNTGTPVGSPTSGAAGTPVGSPTSGAAGTPVGSPTSGAAGTGVYIPTAKETGLSGASIQSILINLLRWLLGIVGVVALIGFAISGVQYILAAGSDEMVTTAKKNMVNSIIGIVVVLASLVIVQAIDYALRAQGSF